MNCLFYGDVPDRASLFVYTHQVQGSLIAAGQVVSATDNGYILNEARQSVCIACW